MYAVISSPQPPRVQRVAPSVLPSLPLTSCTRHAKDDRGRSMCLEKPMTLFNACVTPKKKKAHPSAQFSSRLHRKKIKRSSRRRIFRFTARRHILHEPCQSPSPPAHTHMGLWISTWHLLRLRVTCGQPKGGHSQNSCRLQRCLISHSSRVHPQLLEWPWRGLFQEKELRCHLKRERLSQPAGLIFLRSRGTLW